jgi:hypothetical protein
MTNFLTPRLRQRGCYTQHPAQKQHQQMPPNHQHSTILNRFPWKKNAWAHGVMGLVAISGVTTHRPQLPPYRVRNIPRCISGWFKVGSRWLVNAYSSHPIHCGRGDNSTTKAWDHGGGQVGL